MDFQFVWLARYRKQLINYACGTPQLKSLPGIVKPMLFFLGFHGIIILHSNIEGILSEWKVLCIPLVVCGLILGGTYAYSKKQGEAGKLLFTAVYYSAVCFSLLEFAILKAFSQKNLVPFLIILITGLCIFLFCSHKLNRAIQHSSFKKESEQSEADNQRKLAVLTAFSALGYISARISEIILDSKTNSIILLIICLAVIAPVLLFNSYRFWLKFTGMQFLSQDHREKSLH